MIVLLIKRAATAAREIVETLEPTKRERGASTETKQEFQRAEPQKIETQKAEPQKATVAIATTTTTPTLMSSVKTTPDKLTTHVNEVELDQIETEVESYISSLDQSHEQQTQQSGVYYSGWKNKYEELEKQMKRILEENQLLLEENSYLAKAVETMNKRLLLKTLPVPSYP